MSDAKLWDQYVKLEQECIALKDQLAEANAKLAILHCPWCSGTGRQWTGIDEMPSLVCDRCDGTGLKSSGAL